LGDWLNPVAPMVLAGSVYVSIIMSGTKILSCFFLAKKFEKGLFLLESNGEG
jgi:hypothetical protein